MNNKIFSFQFECCGLKQLNLEHKSSSDKSCFVDNDTTKERLKVNCTNAQRNLAGILCWLSTTNYDNLLTNF